jgi:hypothetical protein
MKLLSFLLLLLPIVGLCQQKKTYLQGYGGLSWSNEATTKGVAGVSGGRTIWNNVAVGLGIGFIQFEKPYIPLTVDLSFMPSGKKVNLIAGVKAGYGIFKYDPSISTSVRGGFFSTAFAGIALGTGKVRPNITIGGTRYTFRSKYPAKTVGSDDKRMFAGIGLSF